MKQQAKASHAGSIEVAGQHRGRFATLHPALKAVLKIPTSGANVARTVVAVPHSEFLAGNGAECHQGSIYGSATAIWPLLDQPLGGPVYLRSSSNPLPDLVVALHGQIDFNLVGRIDSKIGGTRTSFGSVPDAPVSGFILQMQGGNERPVVTNSCSKKKAARSRQPRDQEGRPSP